MLSLELHMAQGLQCLGADWPSDYVKQGLQEVTQVALFFWHRKQFTFLFSFFFSPRQNLQPFSDL